MNKSNTAKMTEEKVFSYIGEHGMLKAGDRVVAGVSGGADSVCLLFLLLEYRKRVPIELAVVHVDHGIREDAAEDAAYVEKLCAGEAAGGEKIPFFLYKVDVRTYAAKEKCSEEDAGRRLRYRAFEQAAEAFGADRIAVAHNAGDRAETMLFHLFRGSGTKGLRGILPVRDRIIRPLLCLERREIEGFLEAAGISWRTDSTNEQDVYARNKIRHHILPYAEKEIFPGAAEHMCRTAEILAQTEDYLEQETKKAMEGCATAFWTAPRGGQAGGMVSTGEEKNPPDDVPYRLELDIDAFLGFHPVIRKRMLLAALEKLSPTGKDIEAVHIEQTETLFAESGNRSLDLPMGIRAFRQYGKVVLERRDMEAAEELSPPGMEFQIFFWKKDMEVPEKRYTKWFDYDKIEVQPKVRFRQTGDYLTLSDGKGNMIHKSLKDYMVTEKIPRELRDRIPVLAEGSHVLWLAGYRISEYYKVDGNTKRVLQVQLRQDCTGRETEEKMAEHIRVLLSEEEVDRRIKEIGEQISRDYAGKQVHLVCVLKGGSFFLCELAKRISVPVSLDFMSVSSYGSDTKSSGVVKIVKDLDESLKDKDVIIVEDIVDSGRTLSYLMEMLRDRGPASLRLCTLLDKPERRVIDVNVDYTGFQIPDEFVVGYGLDYDQKYRNLPYIGVVELEKQEA